MTVTTGTYDPLFVPRPDDDWTPPVDIALGLARKALASAAVANIHNHDAMLRAAGELSYVLRDLVAALDKEPGQ